MIKMSQIQPVSPPSGWLLILWHKVFFPTPLPISFQLHTWNWPFLQGTHVPLTGAHGCTLLLRCHCFYTLSENRARKNIFLRNDFIPIPEIPYSFFSSSFILIHILFPFWWLLFANKLTNDVKFSWDHGSERNSWSFEEKGDALLESKLITRI